MSSSLRRSRSYPGTGPRLVAPVLHAKASPERGRRRLPSNRDEERSKPPSRERRPRTDLTRVGRSASSPHTIEASDRAKPAPPYDDDLRRSGRPLSLIPNPARLRPLRRSAEDVRSGLPEEEARQARHDGHLLLDLARKVSSDRDCLHDRGRLMAHAGRAGEAGRLGSDLSKHKSLLPDSVHLLQSSMGRAGMQGPPSRGRSGSRLQFGRGRSQPLSRPSTRRDARQFLRL